LIVIDASAVWELLRRRPGDLRLMDLVLAPGASVHAPDLVNVEVLHLLRRHACTGQVTLERSEEMRRDLADLPIHRYPTWPLMERVWALRDGVTAYDGMYVALAEALGATLVTADHALARAAAQASEVLIETVS
jgi:predicted nucleic acid-binding protein